MQSTIKDLSGNTEQLLDRLPFKDKFDYVYLDDITFEHLSEILTTKHYPLDDLVVFTDEMEEASRLELFDKKLKSVQHAHILLWKENMQEWLNLNPNKRGTVYFSPAATFATLGVKAKPVYIFVGALVENELWIQSESNYLIV